MVVLQSPPLPPSHTLGETPAALPPTAARMRLRRNAPRGFRSSRAPLAGAAGRVKRLPFSAMRYKIMA